VTGVLRSDDGRVRGVVVRDADGRHQQLQARITIGADGIRSRVAREVGAVTSGLSEHTSALVLGYLDGLEVDGYQWLYGTTTSAGLIPTNDGLVCAWLSAPSAGFARLREGGEAGFHATFAAVAPDWGEAVRRARRVGPLRGFAGSPGFLRHPWGRGWALVGDASHFKDPLSAHGMTDALRDAELLTDAVLTAAADERQEAAALAGYHDLRDELSRDLHVLVDRAARLRLDHAGVARAARGHQRRDASRGRASARPRPAARGGLTSGGCHADRCEHAHGVAGRRVPATRDRRTRRVGAAGAPRP
jgi:2-polyprenyl-6-methoxyphenol hydroxylase-like FAD-dependent oxidoreductase